MINRYNMLINGYAVSASHGKCFDSVNPSTGEVWAQVPDGTADDIEAAVIAARKAFDRGIWSNLSVRERGIYLKKIAGVIRDNAKVLSELESMDTGKTMKHTTFIDVPTCAETFEYFSNTPEDIFERSVQIDAPVSSVVRREPLGVIAQIVPWNYPLIFFAWKVAPALIAGNTIVFRPSQLSSVSTLSLADMIKDIGMPVGVLNVVTCKDHAVVSRLTGSPLVDKISFTGGTETGKSLIHKSADTLKRLTLELGGKSPNIVFSDCDKEAAVGGALSAIFMNQGQLCTAGSRLLLDEKIHDRFLDELAARAGKLKIGPAHDRSTDFGPLISEEQRESVIKFVRKGVEEGARLVCGGRIPGDGDLPGGYYFEPAIFADVNNSMGVAREEIFGPVLCVIKFSSVEEAVSIANDSDYGLAACVWTKDGTKAEEVSGKLKCGTVWINTYGGFYNEAPYGGYKRSGYGRELGLEGILENTQTKHICADATPGGKALVTHWF